MNQRASLSNDSNLPSDCSLISQEKQEETIEKINNIKNKYFSFQKIKNFQNCSIKDKNSLSFVVSSPISNNQIIRTVDLEEINLSNLNTPKIIANRFLVVCKIGSGTFGSIYHIIDIETKEDLAIKIQKKFPDKRKFKLLRKEAEIIRDLSHQTGFPKITIFFKDSKRGYLVMSYLGKNLASLLKLNKGKFSLKTTVMIGLQLIDRVETLHKKNIIHRDMKPENITIGSNGDYKTIYLIDFGLSKKYIDENGDHIKYKEKKGLVGTIRYSSINSQKGLELSRRDDLISIAYILIYFIKSELPWQKIQSAKGNQTRAQKYNNILNIKINTTNKALCECIPSQFLSFINYITNLKFDQVPDYQFLRDLLKEILKKYNYEEDYEFDWRFFGSSVLSLNDTFGQIDENEGKENEEISKIKQFPSKGVLSNTYNYAHLSKSGELNSENDEDFNSFVKPKGINLNARKIFDKSDLNIYYKKFDWADIDL